MGNLSITSHNISGAFGDIWTSTAQICMDQARYDSLGIQMAVGLGFAFLVGWFLGYYFEELGRNKK